MQGLSDGNHAAAAWVAGHMGAAERQEFAAHLATCADCQAQVAALLRSQAGQPAKPRRGIWRLLIGGLVILLVGYALGWAIWQLAHR